MLDVPGGFVASSGVGGSFGFELVATTTPVLDESVFRGLLKFEEEVVVVVGSSVG